MNEMLEIVGLGIVGVLVALYFGLHLYSVVLLAAGARVEGRADRLWAAWVTVTTAIGAVILVGMVVREAIR